MVTQASFFGEVLDHPEAREILECYINDLVHSPMVVEFRTWRLGQVAAIASALDDVATAKEFWAKLATIDAGTPRQAYPPAIAADPEYEAADIPRGSARCEVTRVVPLWDKAEVRLSGPSHGNPFVDVELTAEFRKGDRCVIAGGFYDGDGRYLIRLMADEPGEWYFTTRSSARSLDGITGSFVVGKALESKHGPVRTSGYHFEHADGFRYRPVGTTAYVWTHQPELEQEQTLTTLASSAFNKMRMAVFPKSYLYNSNEPERFPFPGSLAEGFDFTQFDVEFFRALENRIAQLAELGVEADLILFHPYDRWGFIDLGPAVDERYLSYVVRRLASFANVWWAMANEYDFVWSKGEEDWERLATVIQKEDPSRHLTSIHNARVFYDNNKPWITHASLQRVDTYRTSENTDAWREQWRKPVVIDECGYEGNVEQGWGNLSGQELVRRCWEGAVRGGYVGHGETYINDEEKLWWSKGGQLVGSSPDRMAFLDEIISEAPGGAFEPMRGEWDAPRGGVDGQYFVIYYGFNRPAFRNVALPPGTWVLDVIDTWNMTTERLPGSHSGSARVELPSCEYMAVRGIRTGEAASPQ